MDGVGLNRIFKKIMKNGLAGAKNLRYLNMQ
jgi:hypothetical protein